MMADSLPAEEDPNPYIVHSSQKHGQGLFRMEDGKVEKEVEDGMSQKMDEDWRPTDGALTEEAGSVDARWAASASLTAASENMVDMVDTDLMEEMDAEGCDAGEALADTDGISMGDVSLGSVDEAGAGAPAGSQRGKKRQEEIRAEEEEAGDRPAEGSVGSTTEDPSVLVGVPRNKPTFSHETGQRRNLHNVTFSDFTSLQPQKTRNKNEAAVWQREGSGGWCENYVEIFQNCGGGPHQTYEAVTPQASGPRTHRLDCQPRLRLLSISVPADTDASLTSSRSESALFSLSDSDLEGHVVPFLDDPTGAEQDIGEDRIYEDTGHASEDEGSAATQSRRIQNSVGQRRFISGLELPSMSSSPMLGSKQKNHAKPLYLSRYPRSVSMEAQASSAGVYSYMEGSPKQGGAVCFSGSVSRCSPSHSALSTPTSVVDIPPPFELAYITKRPITKSSPALFVGEDASEKTRKKKSSLKHFLMLKFRRKTDGKSAADVSPSSFKASCESIQHTSGRPLDPDRRAATGSPRLTSHCSTPRLSHAPPSTFLLHEHNKGKGSPVAFLNRSVARVESFEERSRAPFMPLPLTKPRSISFPNTDTSDYENVPPLSSDYENVQVPQRRPLPDFFGRPARPLTSASETDGYVDMSSLPGFKGKSQPLGQQAER